MQMSSLNTYACLPHVHKLIYHNNLPCSLVTRSRFRSNVFITSLHVVMARLNAGVSMVNVDTPAFNRAITTCNEVMNTFDLKRERVTNEHGKLLW